MTLRLLCDEHVGDPVYPMLADRFDLEHVLGVLGPGTPDKDIWRYAVEGNQIVFTNDRDYVDGAADPGDETHPGVILYSGEAWEEVVDAMSSIDRSMATDEIIAGNLELFVPGGWTG
jgi:predicted nuclease of predicted toxin-antitoxin system